jgi:hypothetical protein
MPDNIHTLHAVAPPSVASEIRASLIAEIERTLEEAKAGDITEIVMVIQHADTTEWSERSSLLSSMMTWAGRMGAVQLTMQLKSREGLL